MSGESNIKRKIFSRKRRNTTPVKHIHYGSAKQRKQEYIEEAAPELLNDSSFITEDELIKLEDVASAIEPDKPPKSVYINVSNSLY